MTLPEHRSLTVQTDEEGLRLDRWLRRRLSMVPLGRLQRMVRKGEVRIDGARIEGGHRLVPGTSVEFRVPPALWAEWRETSGASGTRAPPTQSSLDPQVLHRDDDVLLIHKPRGIAVHGGTAQADHIEGWVRTAVAPTLSVASDHFRPAPAHRLDRETSGVLAIGVSPAGQRGLAAAFRDDLVEKTYLALVRGEPEAQGVVNAPLRRVEARRGDRPKAVVDEEQGRTVETRWRVRARGPNRAVVEVGITGGFMHQIRAHLTHAGHPLLGDVRYGGGRSPEGLWLHAWRLRLDHPVAGTPLVVEAVPPTPLRT